MNLPILTVDIKQLSIESNVDAFCRAIESQINAVNLDLNTDEDFVKAKQDLSLFAEIESNIALGKKRLFEQCRELNLTLSALDGLDKNSSTVRLKLSKQVKEREATIKANIVNAFHSQAREMVGKLASSLPFDLIWPAYDPTDRLKGVKTIKTYNDRCAEVMEIFRYKVNEFYELIVNRHRTFIECTTGYSFLFSNVGDFLQHHTVEQIDLLSKARIAEYKASQEVEYSYPLAQVFGFPSPPVVRRIEPMVFKESVDLETGEVVLLTEKKDQNPKIVGAPDRIYLCYGEITEDTIHSFCDDPTWCSERIHESDVCYVKLEP